MFPGAFDTVIRTEPAGRNPQARTRRPEPAGWTRPVTEKLLLGFVMLPVFGLAVSYAFLERELGDNGYPDVRAWRLLAATLVPLRRDSAHLALIRAHGVHFLVFSLLLQLTLAGAAVFLVATYLFGK